MNKEKYMKKIFGICVIFLIILLCFSWNTSFGAATIKDKAREIIDNLEENPDAIENVDLNQLNEWIEVLEDADENLGGNPAAATDQDLKTKINRALDYTLYPQRQVLEQEQEEQQQQQQQQNGDDEAEESPAFSHGSWIAPEDYNPGELQDADEIINIGNVIIGVFKFIGMVVSILALIVLGVKYMVGSVEEKAEYKQTMWPYIVGAGLLFATTTILSIIEALAKEI